MQPTPASSLRTECSRRHRAWTTPLHAAVLLALLALGACRDPKVMTYRVAKDTAPSAAKSPEAAAPTATPAPTIAAPGAPAPDSHGLQTASGPGLAWTAPASWQPRQGSMMRKATYAIVGEGGAAADLAVTAFPGDVGGDVANVNRWRGQLGLDALGDAEAAAAIQRLDVGGLRIGVVDIVGSGAAPAHLLGAMVPYEGATWFFKLVGPDAVVGKEKAAFLEFVKTIKPAAAPTP